MMSLVIWRSSTHHFLVPVVICFHFNGWLSERRSYAFWLAAPDRAPGCLPSQKSLSNWQHSAQLASDCSVKTPPISKEISWVSKFVTFRKFENLNFGCVLTVTVLNFLSAPFLGGFEKIFFIISCSSVSWFTVGFEFWVWVWTTVFTFTRVVTAVGSVESSFHFAEEIVGTFLQKKSFLIKNGVFFKMAAIFQYTYGSSGGLFLTHLFVISHFLEKVFIESFQFGQTLKRMSWWDLKFDFSKNSFSDQNIIFESKIVIFIISNHCLLNFGSNSSENSIFE